MPIDPGPPPRLGDPATDQAFKDQAVEVIRDSSLLDPASGDDDRHLARRASATTRSAPTTARATPVNPATGQPYAPDVVNEGDFGRVMAEFWADGPKSETPPGHWNVLANLVSDELAPDLRIGGTGAGRRSARSGTSSCTWPSTAPSTTRPSPPGASRATTTPPGRSR